MVGGRGGFFLVQTANSSLGMVVNMQACVFLPLKHYPLKEFLRIPPSQECSLVVDESVSSPGPRSQYQAYQHVLPNLDFRCILLNQPAPRFYSPFFPLFNILSLIPFTLLSLYVFLSFPLTS